MTTIYLKKGKDEKGYILGNNKRNGLHITERKAFEEARKLIFLAPWEDKEVIR